MGPSFLRQFVRASRNFELTWRYGFNFAPTISYKFAPHSITKEAERVLRELNSRGIAMTSVNSLLQDSSIFQELNEKVEELERERNGELATRRAAANNADIGQKTFNVEMLGSNPSLDPDSVYARFALQQPILQIANAYFGMYTRLRYYNVWHTFATTAQPRESQLWHYDREDHFIFKVFVYLSDVSQDAGPFTYAPGSHLKKGLADQPKYFVEGGVRRSNDDQMAEVVPREHWINATGPRGTIVFADTRGYHKGGLARTNDRLMYLCMFTSPASESQELFQVRNKLEPQRDRAMSYALSHALRT